MKLLDLQIEKVKNGYQITAKTEGETMKIAQINRAVNIPPRIFNKVMVALMCRKPKEWGKGVEV